MKQLTSLAFLFSLAAPVFAQEGTGSGGSSAARSVPPALQGYTDTVVINELWQRPQLSRRDRSLVTLAALIARAHTAGLAAELDRALSNGVTPTEISETVTHLAFYAGWGTALTADPIVAEVFKTHGINAAELPRVEVEFLPQDAEGEAARVKAVAGLLGDALPGLAQFTTDPLFSKIWLRPGLAPRDRSLVTITSLIALGQTGQLAGHLNRALDNGLKAEEAGEVVAHLAFYSGWPTAFSAGPVVREVLDKRAAK